MDGRLFQLKDNPAESKFAKEIKSKKHWHCYAQV